MWQAALPGPLPQHLLPGAENTDVFRRSSPIPDQGFTLLEVVMALAIIGVVMASVGTFIVGGLRATHRQGEQQTAVQFAIDGVEEARMLRGGALVAGRSACTSASTCPAPGVSGAMATTAVGTGWQGRYDMGTATARLAPPAYPEQQTVEGVTFQRRIYIRKCWGPRAGGGTCANLAGTPDPAVYALFWRVVVAVSWRNSGCAASTCSHAITTLFTGSLTDPVFRT
jgi:prepilin-type N-terminal cleavage/methylation domain-containing protein